MIHRVGHIETYKKKYIMKLNLLSCDAAKPDRRAISRCIAEIAIDVDQYTATEFTAFILDGDPVDIEIGSGD